jgi:DNA-binding NarL/FixJ family response regulator
MLTKREKAVMELLVRGFSNKGIAKKLKISCATVATFICNIYNKYGLSKSEDYDVRQLAIRQYIKDSGLCYCNV